MAIEKPCGVGRRYIWNERERGLYEEAGRSAFEIHIDELSDMSIFRLSVSRV